MVGWNTTLEAAIDALVTAWTNAAGLQGVTTTDGPAVVDAATNQLLTVGHQANSTDDLAANVQTAPEGWGGSPQREQIEIYCSASAYTGDDAQSSARALAIGIYKGACAAVLADTTLGGTVMRATPSSWILHQAAVQQGRVATVNFSIAIDAYTT